MSKLSLELHIHKSTTITFAMLNFWSLTPSKTWSYGRLADEIYVNFKNFKIHCRLMSVYPRYFVLKVISKQTHKRCPISICDRSCCLFQQWTSLSFFHKQPWHVVLCSTLFLKTRCELHCQR